MGAPCSHEMVEVVRRLEEVVEHHQVVAEVLQQNTAARKNSILEALEGEAHHIQHSGHRIHSLHSCSLERLPQVAEPRVQHYQGQYRILHSCPGHDSAVAMVPQMLPSFGGRSHLHLVVVGPMVLARR